MANITTVLPVDSFQDVGNRFIKILPFSVLSAGVDFSFAGGQSQAPANQINYVVVTLAGVIAFKATPLVTDIVVRKIATDDYSIVFSRQVENDLFVGGSGTSLPGSTFETLAAMKAVVALDDLTPITLYGKLARRDIPARHYIYDAADSSTANDASVVALDALPGRMIQIA